MCSQREEIAVISAYALCANFKGLEVITFYVQGYGPRLKKSTKTENPFLGACATFRKATVSFVMSACLCPHGRARLPLTDIQEI
jgi:hypothetical protein